MGYQQWTTGQVLTSTAMNQVGDSTVNVFADSSARSTAISSPSEGMVSYLQDTNQIEIYTGAAWAGIGDIRSGRRHKHRRRFGHRPGA